MPHASGRGATYLSVFCVRPVTIHGDFCFSWMLQKGLNEPLYLQLVNFALQV